jgi:hypothetical protein
MIESTKFITETAELVQIAWGLGLRQHFSGDFNLSLYRLLLKMSNNFQIFIKSLVMTTFLYTNSARESEKFELSFLLIVLDLFNGDFQLPNLCSVKL